MQRMPSQKDKPKYSQQQMPTQKDNPKVSNTRTTLTFKKNIRTHAYFITTHQQRFRLHFLDETK